MLDFLMGFDWHASRSFPFSLPRSVAIVLIFSPSLTSLELLRMLLLCCKALWDIYSDLIATSLKEKNLKKWHYYDQVFWRSQVWAWILFNSLGDVFFSLERQITQAWACLRLNQNHALWLVGSCHLVFPFTSQNLLLFFLRVQCIYGLKVTYVVL